MNSSRGTIAILANDLKTFTWIFWGITLLLAVIWIVIGMLYQLPSNTIGTIFGPLYGGIVAVSGMMYSNSYRPAISLGSTRPQYTMIFSRLALLFAVSSILIINLFYYIAHLLFEHGITSVALLHPGMLYSDYHFAAYLWIDLMIGIGLMGITMIATSFIFKYGFLRIAVITMIPLLALSFGFVLGNLGDWMYILFTEKVLITFHCFGAIGVVSLFTNYLFTRHAPLTYHSRNG